MSILERLRLLFPKKESNAPQYLSGNTHSFTVGQEVLIYDRYRFAIALRGAILRFSTASGNDGVELSLLTANGHRHPVGSKVWVSWQQLRPIPQL